MICLMTKGKSDNHLTLMLVLVLFLLLGGILYFSIPVIKKTDVYKNYENNKEVTFVSKRANFSFKHPNSWPVVTEPDGELKTDNIDVINNVEVPVTDTIIESIDFNNEWYRNAGGSRYGRIQVVRMKDITSLEDYVKSIDKDTIVNTPKGSFTVAAPKISYTTVGKERAIIIGNTNTLGNLSPSGSEYVVVKNGLTYTFVESDSPMYFENRKKNQEIFQKIISSVRFF